MKKILNINNINLNFDNFEDLKNELELILFKAGNSQSDLNEYDKNIVDGYKHIDALIELDNNIILPPFINIDEVN